MDSNTLQLVYNALATNGAKLITLGGTINPYLGAAIALIIGGLMIYLGFKKKAVQWQEDKTKSGEQISQGTSAAQPVLNNVNKVGDSFLDQDKDKK